MITAVAEENEIMLLMFMMLMIMTILIIIMISNRSWFDHWQETLWIEIYRRLIILIKQMIVLHGHRCRTGCRWMMPRNTKCAVIWWHHTVDDVRAATIGYIHRNIEIYIGQPILKAAKTTRGPRVVHTLRPQRDHNSHSKAFCLALRGIERKMPFGWRASLKNDLA